MSAAEPVAAVLEARGLVFSQTVADQHIVMVVPVAQLSALVAAIVVAPTGEDGEMIMVGSVAGGAEIERASNGWVVIWPQGTWSHGADSGLVAAESEWLAHIERLRPRLSAPAAPQESLQSALTRSRRA